jgi:serpin B
MMRSNRMPVRLFQEGDLTYLEIPYGLGQFSLSVLIPPADIDINEYLGRLTLEDLSLFHESSNATDVALSMPSFSVEFEQNLNDMLKSMGIGKVFSDRAELNNLFENDVPMRVREVKHKALIEVNEQGSEAAATTSVGIAPTSLPPMIQVDRSFIFMVKEGHTGTFLFTGILRDPSE